jgi:hypothetical protein
MSSFHTASLSKLLIPSPNALSSGGLTPYSYVQIHVEVEHWIQILHTTSLSMLYAVWYNCTDHTEYVIKAAVH